jgi:hypothetical protein
MKTDPTDTGGLFVGRRPGTRPVRYRSLPERGSVQRQIVDRAIAWFLQFLMILINLTFWGPLPIAWLWVASQVQYWTDNVFAGIVAGFAGLIASLLVGLVILKRLDHTWILVRRAAGYDQRQGRMVIIFAVACVLGTIAFTFWLLIIQGPGSNVGPANGG